ncbi:MAG: hypothetical protein ACK42H_10855 [Planctomycetota bacterium]
MLRKGRIRTIAKRLTRQSFRNAHGFGFMGKTGRLMIALLAFVLAMFPFETWHPLNAQDPSPAPSGSMMPPENLPRVVGPGVLPDLMYMRNSKGEEILVPRARYEDFERLLMETELGGEGLTATPSLNQLDLVIEPVTDYAKIQVRGMISLKKANRTTWTVPIALSQLQWIPGGKEGSGVANKQNDSNLQETQESLDGLESISATAQANGYLWRVGPGKSLQKRLFVDAVCKFVSTPSGNTLRLDLPPAATVVKLKLPKGDWDLNATGGGNEVVEPFQIQGEHSIAIVRTSANSINLTWSRKTTRDAIAAVEIRSQTKFSPSGDTNRWRADSAIAIRGPAKLGGKRIRWILPPQAILREANSDRIVFSNYRLVKSSNASPSGNTDPPTLVSDQPSDFWWIEIDEAYGRSELDLNLEWELKRLPNDSQVRFEAPKLEGVDRHNGTVEFSIPRINSIDWSPIGNVQLVRQSQASDGSESIVYTFQFEGQAAGISTLWTTIADRPKITSQQRIEIRENQLILRGLIEFGSDPIQLPLLQFEAEGWKPERLALYPSDIDVPLDSIPDAGKSTAENPLGGWSLPISSNLWIRSSSKPRANASDSSRSDRPSESGPVGLGLGNPFEILANSTDRKESTSIWKMEYLLSRTHSNESKELSLSLPRLSWLSQESQQRVSRTIPGSLLIYSWPYRLAADPKSSSGLVETSLDRNMQQQVFSSGSGPWPFLLQYQIADSASVSRWVGSRTRKGSFVTAGLSAKVSPVRDSIQWNLRWDCSCLGSRPTSLNIGLPIDARSIDAKQAISDLSVQIDNTAVPVEWIDPEVSIPGYRWVKLSIPEVAIDGSNRLDFLLEAKYISDQPLLKQLDQQVTLDLELAILESAKPTEQVLVETIAVATLDSDSLSLRPFSESNQGIISIDPSEPRVSLTANRRSSEPKSNVNIEGEWIQTIVNALEQRDRYVVRFQTDQKSISMPTQGATIREAEWMLDGQRAIIREDSEKKGWAIVSLPDSNTLSETKAHVLEVFTTQSVPKGWFRKVQPIGPRFAPNPARAPLIWQIIVPRTEHLVSSTQNALPMYRWRWRDLVLRRVGETSQEQIEDRFGATKQPILARQVNQYDLTSIASNQPLEASFVPSAVIWLPVSLFVLCIATVIKDNRWIRWPWFWGLLLGGFFIFSQLAWDISLLVLQATVASVGLAAIYTMTRWLMDRRARRRSIFVSRQYASSHSNAKASPGVRNSKKATSEDSALKSTVTVKTRESR